MSAVAESRLPVGSSATISGGSLASARAIATRCCCPPEVLDGSLRAWSAMPTRSSRSIARSKRSRGVHSPPKSIGSITFSTTVRVGSSWKNWKITPIVRPRHSAVLPSDSPARSWPADGHRAAGRPVDAGDHVHQRRLAAARPPDDRDELAPVHLEVDAVERPERPRVGDVVLDHAAQVDQVLAARGRAVLADAPVRAVARSAKHVGSRMPNPVGEQVRRAVPAAAESIRPHRIGRRLTLAIYSPGVWTTPATRTA